MPYNVNDKEEVKKIQLKMLKYMASFNKEKFNCDMYGKGGFNYEEFKNISIGVCHICPVRIFCSSSSDKTIRSVEAYNLYKKLENPQMEFTF